MVHNPHRNDPSIAVAIVRILLGSSNDSHQPELILHPSSSSESVSAPSISAWAALSILPFLLSLLDSLAYWFPWLPTLPPLQSSGLCLHQHFNTVHRQYSFWSMVLGSSSFPAVGVTYIHSGLVALAALVFFSWSCHLGDM